MCRSGRSIRWSVSEEFDFEGMTTTHEGVGGPSAGGIVLTDRHPKDSKLSQMDTVPREPLEVVHTQYQDPTVPKPPGGLGYRHYQALLMFSVFVVSYLIRINLSVGIVAMVSQPGPNGEVLKWSSEVRGLILSSFFWGYLVLQIPAGMAAERWGPCKLLGATTAISGVLTALTPIAASSTGWAPVCAIRVLVGLAQGFIYPCANAHLSKWCVPQERSRVVSFTFGGTQLGTIIMMMVGGALAAGPGWPSIFYFSGGISLLWGLVIVLLGCDSPEKSSSISEEEKTFIKNSLVFSSVESASMKTPWLELVRSTPLWALLLVNMGSFWGYWTILTLLPSYIDSVLHFDIQSNGLMSAFPYFVMWIATIVFGILADYINKKKWVSLNFARKMWNSIAHYGEAISLILLGTVDTNGQVAMILMTITVALNAATYSGYLSNHLDLSPNFAGTLMGITNGLSNISSILGPLVAGYIITDGTKEQWHVVFFISAGIFMIGNTIFIIFGSTDIQPWNDPNTKNKNIKNRSIVDYHQ